VGVCDTRHTQCATDGFYLCSVDSANRIIGIQDLSNTAWSIAALRIQNDPLLASIATRSLRSLLEFTSDNLAITAWVYAKRSYYHVPLFESIAAPAIPNITAFRSLNLSNTVWSLAELAITDAPLLSAISASALPRILEFGPPDLSSTAWAFARCTVRDRPLLEALSAQSRAQDADGMLVSAMRWAAWRYGNFEFGRRPSADDAMSLAFLLMQASWSRDHARDVDIRRRVGGGEPCHDMP